VSAAATIVRWSVPELELGAAESGAVAVEEIQPEQAPPPPTLEEIQAIQSQAREAGHAEGFLDGQAQGFAQGEAQVRRLIAQIEGILDNFTRPLARLEGEVAAALGELAVRIAGHLTGRAYVAEPHLLAALVSAALAAVGEITRPVEVRLHPDDVKPLSFGERGRGGDACEPLARVTSERPACFAGPDWGEGASARDNPHQPPANIHLTPDPTLSRGDVRVHADTLRIDGTLNARLDVALAEVIAQAGERA